MAENDMSETPCEQCGMEEPSDYALVLEEPSVASNGAPEASSAPHEQCGCGMEALARLNEAAHALNLIMEYADFQDVQNHAIALLERFCTFWPRDPRRPITDIFPVTALSGLSFEDVVERLGSWRWLLRFRPDLITWSSCPRCAAHVYLHRAELARDGWVVDGRLEESLHDPTVVDEFLEELVPALGILAMSTSASEVLYDATDFLIDEVLSSAYKWSNPQKHKTHIRWVAKHYSERLTDFMQALELSETGMDYVELAGQFQAEGDEDTAALVMHSCPALPTASLDYMIERWASGFYFVSYSPDELDEHQYRQPSVRRIAYRRFLPFIRRFLDPMAYDRLLTEFHDTREELRQAEIERQRESEEAWSDDSDDYNDGY